MNRQLPESDLLDRITSLPLFFTVSQVCTSLGCHETNRIVAAVSGGGDSVAMALLVAPYAKARAIEFMLAYFDHETDPARNAREWALVQGLAHQLGAGAVRGRKSDYKSVAGFGPEDRWRNKRYAFLKDQAGPAGMVITAHTMDDNAESFLLAAVRGGSGAALSSIRTSRMDGIARPFLGIRRVELRTFLSLLGVQWISDPTNRDLAKTRAFLRHRVLPHLAERFGNAAVAGLSRSADLIGEWEDLIQQLSQDALKVTFAEKGHGKLILDLVRLGEYHAAVQRRVLRLVLERLYGAHRIPLTLHIDRLLRFITEEGTRLSLPQGLQAERTAQSRLSLGPFSPRATPDFLCPMAIPGVTWIEKIGEGIRASVLWTPRNVSPLMPVGSDCAVLDAEQLTGPLLVRNRNPGDRFSPVGFGQGRVRLKKYLRDHGIPFADRWKCPVVLEKQTDRIVWIPGIARADIALVGPTTRKMLLLCRIVLRT